MGELLLECFYLDLRFEVGFVVGECLFSVALILSILRHHNNRRGVCGLRREEEVKEDEWIGIPVPEKRNNVDTNPERDDTSLNNDKCPRADDTRNSIRNALSRAKSLTVFVVPRLVVSLIFHIIHKYIVLALSCILYTMHFSTAFRVFSRFITVRRRRAPRKRSKEDIALYLKHKETARTLVHRKLEEFNRHYGFTYQHVTIRDQQSRWGSCSKKGNLNFNYRIVLLPEDLADAIIVHELCHLSEFNHSTRFWERVRETIPDVEARRKRLNAYHPARMKRNASI